MTNHKGLDRRVTRMVRLGYALIVASLAMGAAGVALQSFVLVAAGSVLATINMIVLFVWYQVRAWLRSR